MQAIAALVVAAAVAQQVDPAPRFWIENKTDDRVEFWIRASNRNRAWSKIKIEPRNARYAVLKSSDPFDFIVCRLVDGQSWVYERQSGIQLKSLVSGGRQAKTLHLERYVTKPVYQTSNHRAEVVWVQEYLDGRDVQIESDGRQAFMSVEYETGHKPRYPPFPRPRPKK